MLLQVPGDGLDGPLLLRVLPPGRLPPEQGDLQVINAGAKLLVVHGLEDIIRDLQPQGLPAVGEIIVAGHDDKGHVRVFDPGQLDDLQPVHNGDVDVHDGNVRLQGIDLGQSLHAVRGLSHHLAVVAFPVKEPLKALPDHDLIIHQKHTQLFHFASSFSGSRMCAVTPPVSFSV